MTRTIPEWQGRTDDAAIPLRVRLRVYLRTGGICAKCTRRLAPHRWAVDHVIALANGGQHRESNLQPLCISPCHSAKSRTDVALKSKNYRVQAKAAGLRKASQIKSAGFPRVAPQHSATRPLARRADT